MLMNASRSVKVGTGYATSDAEGFVADEDQMGDDFMGFLSNLIQIFPTLRHRSLFMMGEVSFVSSFFKQYVDSDIAWLTAV